MNQEIWIPLGVFGFVTAIVTVATVGKQAGRNRQYAHQERLRALELGQTLHGGTFWPSMAAIAIGAVVPVVAIVFAFLAGFMRSGSDLAWIFGGLVGATGVVCGTFLAVLMLQQRSRESNSAYDLRTEDWQDGKPVVDPDAYDTVGRRG